MLDKSIRISRGRIFAAVVAPHSRTPRIPALAPCGDSSYPKEEKDYPAHEGACKGFQGPPAYRQRPLEALFTEVSGRSVIGSSSDPDSHPWVVRCG